VWAVRVHEHEDNPHKIGAEDFVGGKGISLCLDKVSLVNKLLRLFCAVNEVSFEINDKPIVGFCD